MTRRSSLLLIGLLLSVIPSLAINIDSLQSIWNDESKDDSVRLEALQLISWNGYLFSNLDSSRANAQKQMRFAHETGLVYYEAKALQTIGASHYLSGNHRTAVPFYLEALELFESIEHKRGKAGIYNNLGVLYMKLGRIEKSIKNHMDALKIREALADSAGIAASMNNLGILYQEQEEFEKSKQFYLNSITLKRELGNLKGVATSLNNLGVVLERQKKLDSALFYYKEALNIRIEINDVYRLATSLRNVGITYSAMGNFDQAIDYTIRAYEHVTGIGDLDGLSTAAGSLGTLYLEIGEVDNAKPYAEESMKYAKELGYPKLIRDAADLFRNYYILKGNYELALANYELRVQMQDSIKNEETQKATIRQETQYEFEKAQLVKEQEEKERVRLVAEKTSRRDNLQYSIVLIGLLVIGVLVAMLGKLSLPIRLAEGLIFFAFLIFFEFILVLGDPYIESWTGGAPGLKLLINASIAALIFPLHVFFEGRLKRRLAGRTS